MNLLGRGTYASCLNKKLYNKDPKFLQREKKASENSRNYGKGLDIDGLAAADKHSPDAEDAKYLTDFNMASCNS